jgi:hypothetical protein
MKQKLFFPLILLAYSSIVTGQKHPVLKVYAYSQATLKGVRPGGIVEEGGTEIKQGTAQGLNYYFYIEYRPKEKFSVSALWINGKSFKIKADSILQTPVESNAADVTANNKKNVLVPATANKILLVVPGEQLSNIKPPAWLKKQVAKGGLVIVYKWKGKLWSYAVPKIKVIDPAAGV